MNRTVLLLMSLLATPPVAGLLTLVDAPPVQAQQTSGWEQFFQRIVTRSPLPRKRGGGRDEFEGWKMISPGSWSTQLWALQPSIIWQFEQNARPFPDRIEIRQAGASTTVWSQAVQQNSSMTLPILVKLEPGKTYFVRFLKRNADLQKDEVLEAWKFQIMSSAHRLLVTTALNRIDKTLKPSDLLQLRIEVFARFQLWSDIIQEIDRSSLPIQERQTAIAQFITRLNEVEASQSEE